MTEEEKNQVDHAINALRERIAMLEDQSVVYNNTIVALALLAGIKKGSFKYNEARDFKDFVLNDMRAFASNVMKIAEEANQLIKEEEDARNKAQELAQSSEKLKADDSGRDPKSQD